MHICFNRLFLETLGPEPTCTERQAQRELLGMFQRKYARTGYNRVHILKSLTYFDDAEKDPMPHMLAPRHLFPTTGWRLNTRFPPL